MIIEHPASRDAIRACLIVSPKGRWASVAFLCVFTFTYRPCPVNS